MVMLGMTPEVEELRGRVSAFMDEHIYPNEPVLDGEDGEAEALDEDLRV